MKITLFHFIWINLFYFILEVYFRSFFTILGIVWSCFMPSETQRTIWVAAIKSGLEHARQGRYKLLYRHMIPLFEKTKFNVIFFLLRLLDCTTVYVLRITILQNTFNYSTITVKVLFPQDSLGDLLHFYSSYSE